MAQFQPAYDILQKNEGGYLNDPADHGGETYRGIARNFHRNWPGWRIVDKFSHPPRILRTGAFINDKELDLLVWQFYLDWWNRLGFSQIKNQDIANIFFDFVVLAKSGVRTMQLALISQGFKVKADNRMGPKTISAINAANQKQLFNAFKKRRIAYHEVRVQKGLVASKFLPGWIKRTLSFGNFSGKVKLLGIGAALGLGTIATILFISNNNSNGSNKKPKAA